MTYSGMRNFLCMYVRSVPAREQNEPSADRLCCWSCLVSRPSRC